MCWKLYFFKENCFNLDSKQFNTHLYYDSHLCMTYIYSYKSNISHLERKFQDIVVVTHTYSRHVLILVISLRRHRLLWPSCAAVLGLQRKITPDHNNRSRPLHFFPGTMAAASQLRLADLPPEQQSSAVV